MDTIRKLRAAHEEGTKKQQQMGEVMSDFISIFVGVLFRFAWPGLWQAFQTGIWVLPSLTVIVPATLISLGISVVLLRMSWGILENTDKRVRWAFAFAVGATTSLIIQPPTETALKSMSLIP